ncbi:MAG: ABC transporter permease [Deltaproteobacteria bacterium]|jgi:ABC-2 type transport system permease protein|nr:ABC transporter permease [Deltaproteobacteria bacterium]
MSPALRRICALVRKEFLQVIRDPSSIAIAIVQPLFLLFIFGYGISLDATHVPVACVVDATGPNAREFIGGLYQSQYFSPRIYGSMAEAEQAMIKGDAMATIWIRSDFERQAMTGNGKIEVIVNGVDANTARLVQGYLIGHWGQWLLKQGATMGLELKPRIWFNAEVRSRNYLLPGIIAVIMTLTGTLLTAMVVAREWERGTMEALLSTPVTISEVIVGKVIPYFLLGMAGMGLSVLTARWLFQVPLVGSHWLLLAVSCLYMLAALAMGLFISSFSKNQFIAGQLAIITTYLPAFMLSGFIFDIHSMPTVIQWLTHIIPARYFVTILQTLFLAGDVHGLVIKNAVYMAGLAAFFLLLVARNSRKRLD